MKKLLTGILKYLLGLIISVIIMLIIDFNGYSIIKTNFLFFIITLLYSIPFIFKQTISKITCNTTTLLLNSITIILYTVNACIYIIFKNNYVCSFLGFAIAIWYAIISIPIGKLLEEKIETEGKAEREEKIRVIKEELAKEEEKLAKLKEEQKTYKSELKKAEEGLIKVREKLDNIKEKLADYITDLTWDDIARKNKKGSLGMFEGRIVETIYLDNSKAYIVAINNDIKKLMMVNVDNETSEENFFENDYVLFVGFSLGIISINRFNALPSFNANGIAISNKGAIEIIKNQK